MMNRILAGEPIKLARYQKAPIYLHPAFFYHRRGSRLAILEPWYP